jgi:hypothetical protein
MQFPNATFIFGKGVHSTYSEGGDPSLSTVVEYLTVTGDF